MFYFVVDRLMFHMDLPKSFIPQPTGFMSPTSIPLFRTVSPVFQFIIMTSTIICRECHLLFLHSIELARSPLDIRCLDTSDSQIYSSHLEAPVRFIDWRTSAALFHPHVTITTHFSFQGALSRLASLFEHVVVDGGQFICALSAS